MATSETPDGPDRRGGVVECDGDCGDRYAVKDLHEVGWPNDGGATDRFYDRLCENCVRRMCEAVGLDYEPPANPPEPVDGGAANGDD